MGDITGTTFAGYEVRDVVGTDLVSTIYRAQVPDEDRVVALRIIARDLCVVEGPDRQLYEQFHRQAAASLTFDHPRSPTVEEVGEQRGEGYLISDYVDTISLGEWVAAHPPLEVDAARALLGQVAEVLDARKRDGQTHGAMNPSTVRFARPTGDAAPDTAYLTGYGIGTLLELRLKRDRKRLKVVDDLLYVAPEQLRQQEITGRTDQYALACALAHVLTGAPPFVRASIGGLFGAHLFVDPEFDPAKPWTPVLLRGMAKDPQQRFDSCGALIAALTDATRRPPAAATADRMPTATVAGSAPGGGRGRAKRSRTQAAPAGVTVAKEETEVVGSTSVFPTPKAPAEFNGATVAAPTESEDVPLLSDVLSQHRNSRRRGLLGSPLLLLMITALVAAGLAFWLMQMR